MTPQDWCRRVRERLPALRLAPEREAEIVEELALQLEQDYRDGLAAGSSEEEAAARALARVALDPVAFVAAAAALLACGMLACWAPARRASRVDPMMALRQE